MHSLALQAILQSLQTQFRCPDCGTAPEPKHIHIDAIKGDMMNARIVCQKCNLRSVLYAEVNKPIQDIIDSKTAKELVETLMDNSDKTLSDADIKEVSDTIQSGKNISDIL